MTDVKTIEYSTETETYKVIVKVGTQPITCVEDLEEGTPIAINVGQPLFTPGRLIVNPIASHLDGIDKDLAKEDDRLALFFINELGMSPSVAVGLVRDIARFSSARPAGLVFGDIRSAQQKTAFRMVMGPFILNAYRTHRTKPITDHTLFAGVWSGETNLDDHGIFTIDYTNNDRTGLGFDIRVSLPIISCGVDDVGVFERSLLARFQRMWPMLAPGALCGSFNLFQEGNLRDEKLLDVIRNDALKSDHLGDYLGQKRSPAVGAVSRGPQGLRIEMELYAAAPAKYFGPTWANSSTQPVGGNR